MTPMAKMLLDAARVGVLLLLLTPLIVADTIYPFVVGKALYWRTLVEIVFALWVLLALWVPACRPPRSWLLGLLGIGFVCSLLAAFFGVSPQRSFWSTYERMLGAVNEAHMLAFAIVVVSLFRGGARPGAKLHMLLNLNLGASAVLCLLAAARFFELDVPYYGSLPERHLPRIGGALGNPGWLALFAAMNGTLALGFLARSFLIESASSGRHWARLFWLVTAALNYFALMLASSRGAFLGLLAASAFLAFGGLLAFTRIRPWRLTLGFVGAGTLAIALVLLALPMLTDAAADGAHSRLSEDGTEPFPVAGVYFQDRSARSRLAVWQAGLEGFAARPFFGWGPENFITVFGKFQPGTVKQIKVHDRPHNKLIEEAATKGLLGLASYLGLWLFAFYVVLRASRRLPPPERVLALCAGAALTCHFVQSLTLFDTVITNIQYILFLCYVAWIETTLRSTAGTATSSRWRTSAAERLRAILSNCSAKILAVPRIAVAGAAIALAVAGLLVNQRILSAALIWGSGTTIPITEESIAAFEPLAGAPRLSYFVRVRENWRMIRMQHPTEAKRLLRTLDAEAKAAVAAEPENWVLHHALAWTYLTVAASEPDYKALADHHIRRTYELSPRQQLIRARGEPPPRPSPATAESVKSSDLDQPPPDSPPA